MIKRQTVQPAMTVKRPVVFHLMSQTCMTTSGVVMARVSGVVMTRGGGMVLTRIGGMVMAKKSSLSGPGDGVIRTVVIRVGTAGITRLAMEMVGALEMVIPGPRLVGTRRIVGRTQKSLAGTSGLRYATVITPFLTQVLVTAER